MEINNEQIIKFDRMCRTCLNEGQLLTSLYDENDENNSLSKKLEMCTSIQCNKNDGLPDKICPKCIDVLFQSYNFANKCTTNDATLKQYLNKRNSYSVESSINNEDTYMNLDNNVATELMIKNEEEDDLLFDMLKRVIKNTGIQIIDTALTSELIIKKEVEAIDLTTEEEEQQNIDYENTSLLNTEENESNQIIDTLIKEKQNSNCYENKLEETNTSKTKPEQHKETTAPIYLNLINDTLINVEPILNSCQNEFEETNKNKTKSDHNEKSTAPTSLIVKSIEETESNQINDTFIKAKENPIIKDEVEIMDLPTQEEEQRNIDNENTNLLNTEENVTNQINDTLIIVEQNSNSYKNKLEETNKNKTKPEQDEKSTAPTSCIDNSMMPQIKKAKYNNTKTNNNDSLIETNSSENQIKETNTNNELPEQPEKSTVAAAFSNKYSLRRRNKKVDNIEATIDNNDTLSKEPLNIHNQETNNRNETYSKTYTYTYNSEQPKRAHISESPFKCEACSKAFVCNDALNQHYKWHTKKRPYKCETCPRAFLDSYHLFVHQKSHASELPYKCEACSKSFPRLEHLNKHYRSHTGQRPYKCRICPKTYISLSHLREHVKSHNGQRPHKCQICKKTFNTFKSLIQHTGEHPY